MPDLNSEIELKKFAYFPTSDEILSLFENTNNIITFTIYQRTKCSGVRFYLNDINELRERKILKNNLEELKKFDSDNSTKLFLRIPIIDFRNCFGQIEQFKFCFEKDSYNDYIPMELKEFVLSKLEFMNALYRFSKVKQEGDRIAQINIKQTTNLIDEYNQKSFGKKIPSKQDLEILTYEIANGNKNIGKQYLKIALDSTWSYKKCTEVEAFKNYWFSIIHELGHIYINCKGINFYKYVKASNIKPPSEIDNLPGIDAPYSIEEYHVITWCLILIKIKGWVNPLDLEAYDKQWQMPNLTYYRSYDFFSCYTEWAEGYFLHPLFRLSLLGVNLQYNNYLRKNYENFDVIKAINNQ